MDAGMLDLEDYFSKLLSTRNALCDVYLCLLFVHYFIVFHRTAAAISGRLTLADTPYFITADSSCCFQLFVSFSPLVTRLLVRDTKPL